MSAINYQHLALDWQPSQPSSGAFRKITLVVFAFTFVALFFLATITVTEQPRRERVVVSDRIAEFIAQKEKPIVEPEKPIVKPVIVPPAPKKPEPINEPAAELPKPVEPLREKIQSRNIETKPLTDTQQAARKVAEKTGLLALANELNELKSADSIQQQLGQKTTTNNAAAEQHSGYDSTNITAGVAQTGGKVNKDQYAAAVTNTNLDARNVEQANLGDIQPTNKTGSAGKSKSGNAGDDATIVFNKNKSSLYSLYERERRSTPGLQGKIIFQLTISPSGDVVDVKIISSDLNNPALEARLLSRIKSFKFKAAGDKPNTITYPVEFLPT